MNSIDNIGKTLTILVLGWVTGCSNIPEWNKSEIMSRISGVDGKRIQEYVDRDGNGRPDLVATYLKCGNKIKGPAMIQDIQSGQIYLQRPFLRYSTNRNVILLPGDSRC